MTDEPTGPTLGEGREFDIIRRILAADLPSDRLLDTDWGPGDDGAYLSEPGVVISTDISIEGVHFRMEWLSMRELGRRVCVVALSDLAAMAATPVGLLLSIAVPDHGVADLSAFYDGVGDALRESGAGLLGGDLSRSPGPWIVDVVAVGRTRQPIGRDGAEVGDELWVTGALGGAPMAVDQWLRGDPVSEAARQVWVHVVARTGEALWLAEAVKPTALIDISDGLGGDAGHLAAASGVKIVLDLSSIPIASGVENRSTALELALSGGEEYELLFSAKPGAVQPHVAEFRERFDCALTRIGTVEQGKHVWTREGPQMDPSRLTRGGFSHWEDGKE